MRDFIRRYGSLFALGAAYFGPFPTFDEYVPVGWMFVLLLPSGGFVGSGHYGVGGGGLWVLALVGSFWVVQASVVWLLLIAVLGPAPKDGPAPFISLGLGDRRGTLGTHAAGAEHASAADDGRSH